MAAIPTEGVPGLQNGFPAVLWQIFRPGNGALRSSAKALNHLSLSKSPIIFSTPTQCVFFVPEIEKRKWKNARFLDACGDEKQVINLERPK